MRSSSPPVSDYVQMHVYATLQKMRDPNTHPSDLVHMLNTNKLMPAAFAAVRTTLSDTEGRSLQAAFDNVSVWTEMHELLTESAHLECTRASPRQRVAHLLNMLYCTLVTVSSSTFPVLDFGLRREAVYRELLCVLSEQHVAPAALSVVKRLSRMQVTLADRVAKSLVVEARPQHSRLTVTFDRCMTRHSSRFTFEHTHAQWNITHTLRDNEARVLTVQNAFAVHDPVVRSVYHTTEHTPRASLYATLVEQCEKLYEYKTLFQDAHLSREGPVNVVTVPHLGTFRTNDKVTTYTPQTTTVTVHTAAWLAYVYTSIGYTLRPVNQCPDVIRRTVFV